MMKSFVYLSLAAMLLTGTTTMQAQTKTKAKAKIKTQAKAKSQKTTAKTTPKATANILYVEPEDRNYAQNLGGHMFWDYTAREPHGLHAEYDISKEERKALVDKYSYKTYEEALENLPVLPAASEVDTREKMARYTVELGARGEALDNYEPEPELKAEADRISKLRMEIAKKARKGQPFDTIHIDKKNAQYLKVLEKLKTICTPLYNKYNDNVLYSDAADHDRGCWLLEKQGGAPRFYYNIYSPVVKQMIKEWFGSDECKRVQPIEDELRARVAAENPKKKTPDWFVEGRKREAEIVAQYNRKMIDRWKQKSPTTVLEQCKTAITKLIACNKELTAIRGNDPISSEYISARVSAKGCIKEMFSYYLYLMDLSDIPLVRTPKTQEGAKKFKLEDSPWKLSYPYNIRRE